MPKRAMPITEAEQERQAAVLQLLRANSGLSPTQAAGLIGVSYSQLLRYESGETLLPTSYYGAVATAYGIKKAALTIAIGLMDDAPNMQELLEEVGMPNDEMRQLLSSMAGQETTPEERYAIARFVADVLEKRSGDKKKRRA